jgi:large subunit ribosomal protein L9
MKVILKKDLPTLGEEGDICEVKDGYARNFLIPRDLVMFYNKQNLAILEGKKKAIEQRKEEKRKQAMSLKDRLESEGLEIKMPAGENGKLFGAVTSAVIAEELEKRDVFVERKRIDIPDNTIKNVGNYTVTIHLYEGNVAELKVKVSPAGQEEKKEEAPAEPSQKEELKEEVVEEPSTQEESSEIEVTEENNNE